MIIAKTDENGYILPLEVHLSDTAGVAELLAQKVITDAEIRACGLTADEFRMMLTFLAFVHDIGKDTAFFQSMIMEGMDKEVREILKTNGRGVLPLSHYTDQYIVHHSYAGEEILADKNSETYVDRSIAVIVGAHHGIAAIYVYTQYIRCALSNFCQCIHINAAGLRLVIETLQSELAFACRGRIAVRKAVTPYSVELNDPTSHMGLDHTLSVATLPETAYGSTQLIGILNILHIILVYGMGEKPLKEIVRLLKKGVPFSSLNSIPQTAYLAPKGDVPKNKNWEDLRLYSYEECLASKKNQIENCRRVDIECNKWFQRRILQDVAEQTVVINPAYPPLEYGELDESFEYPYAREPHPRYKKRGNVPAFDMIKFSINTHRGCFGGCSFCAINAHQGKFIASRSRESILREVDLITKMEGFAGTITDLGGPSANMYNMRGRDQSRCQKCARASCLTPKICDNMDTHHAELLELYREVRNHPKVKH